jgi:hypothetical protein
MLAPRLSVRQGEPQQGEVVIGVGGGGAARLKDSGQRLARDFSR